MAKKFIALFVAEETELIMDIFLRVIYTILVLSFLIMVHELGHFLIAKLFKVQVNEFSLGMGPKLIGFRNKKWSSLFLSKSDEMAENDLFTAYNLRLLPIGGYVAMDEDLESDNPNAFNKKPVWQRILITAAGALMNLLIALIIILILVLSTPTPSNVIAQFEDNAASQASGLEIDDEIVKINNTKINNYVDITRAFQNLKANEKIDFTVERNNENVLIEDVKLPQIYATTGEEVTPESLQKDKDDGKDPYLTYGIDFKFYRMQNTIGSVIQQTASQTVSYVCVMYESIYSMVTGKISLEYVSGPVGVSAIIEKAADSGWQSVLSIVALISVNLAVFNLLPLPALDGGRILFQLIELIFRKRISLKVEAAVHSIGLILLLALTVVIALKDIIFPVI